MKCITCKTTMQCVDDVCQETVRIDWEECPKCKSRAEIIYGEGGEFIEKVTWNR